MVSFPNDGSAPFSLGGSYSSGEQGYRNQSVCQRCQHGGVDLKVVDCGCFLHARCAPVLENSPLTNCPACQASARALVLMPMNFDELDEAKAAAASMSPSAKRGKKRKNATIARLNPSNPTVEDGGDGSDLRTGRWTTEETVYCDELIERFDKGNLPISVGIKLNDFLASMLKSKQSRLTKKMKNARLSAKTYKRTNGYVANLEEAKEFSRLEKSFFDSIQCDMERAEIRFHMQKEWRELFSTYCLAMGQKLDADSWLSSVEEMDRRVSQAKDAARMARRKVMMGYALSQDSMNPQQGVFIERSTSTESRSNQILSGNAASNSLIIEKRPRAPNTPRSLRDFSSPFVGKVIQYMDRHQIPFEHIDAWVPSFVPNADQTAGSSDQKCRLCFAGFASTDTQIPVEGGRPIPLSSQDQFDLLSFGEYSSKFSFDVGCGLPGRVYSSGICSWEQGVANAPSQQFERCGGASQWGIKTVLGIPIPSPNVGRIVVLLYSRHDRKRDPEMVRRITEELTKLMPTPKWKLVVDVGAAPPKPENAKPADRRVADLLKLMAEHIPTHRNSPYSPYLPGFTSLRLILVKQTKTPEEADLMSTILESYSSYLSSGRSSSETSWMIARDYMLLSQSSNAAQRQQVQQQPPQQQPVQQLLPQPAQQAQYHQVQQLQHQQAQQLHQQPALQPHLRQPVQQLQVQQIHHQQVVLPQQVHHHHHQQARHSYSQPRQVSQMNAQPQSSTAGVAQHQVGVGLAQSHQQQPQHGLSHQQPGGMSQQQSGTAQVAGSMHQQQKQHFVQAPAITSSSQVNGVSQHQNGINTGSQLAPSPGFSVQQSAFQPIIHHQQHATAHQQQNNHVGV